MKVKKISGNRLIACISCAVFMLTAASCGAAAERDAAESTAAVITETTPAAVTETSAETQTAAPTETTTVSSAETETVTTAEEPPDLVEEPACKAYALWCTDGTGLVAGKKTEKKVSLASITKLLTASVMMKYLDPGYIITVGEEVNLAKPDSTLSYLSPGNEITAEELLYAMFLPSGNDAAYVAAVNTAREASGDPYMSDSDAVDYFCGLMNSFAGELGMEHSHFANPEGWDDKEHYTTVSDLMKLGEYVLSIPELREAVSTYDRVHYLPEGYELYWVNTNLFLDPNSWYYRPDCIGIKTGTTEKAGSCLLSAFEIDGKTYICAVMGCRENEDRYILTGNILNHYLGGEETGEEEEQDPEEEEDTDPEDFEDYTDHKE